MDNADLHLKYMRLKCSSYDRSVRARSGITMFNISLGRIFNEWVDSLSFS